MYTPESDDESRRGVQRRVAVNAGGGRKGGLGVGPRTGSAVGGQNRQRTRQTGDGATKEGGGGGLL